MKAVLSLLFLSILIFCVWSGYKKGLVMGIFSLIAFVVSVYGANLLSQTYSGEAPLEIQYLARSMSILMVAGSVRGS